MSTLPTPPRPARVVVGVTGGIAAYKTAELVRLLVKDGVTVDVVMTQAGTRFVTPTTFQALSGRAVLTDLWASGTDNAMGHIGLSRGADAILVAPASADFLAKLANGHADDLLSTLCLARECALLVAPAMNVQMWNHAATQRNVARLREDGVTILGPGSGDLACNEVGDGRMLEPEDLRAALTVLRSPKLLAGRRVLVTAGPTPLRTPPAVARVDVRSAADMAQAVLDRVDDADVFVAIAAVADYTPAAPSERKLKKSGEALTITLQPTVDILATVAARPSPPYCVGFAAESHDVLENAETKRKRKKLPLLVANRAQDALGSDDNEVTLLDDAGAHPLPRMDKRSLGRRLVEEIGIRLPRAP